MKRAIVGLILLGLVGVANASIFSNNVDNLWTTAGNWSAGEPTGSTDCSIARYQSAVITNYTASARNLALSAGLNAAGSGGNLRVEADGVLNARAVISGKNARLWNYGEVNLTTSFVWGSNATVGYNYGTIDTTQDLSINKIASFNNYGTFNGDTLAAGGNAGAKLNLRGGTMTFDDVTFFDLNNTMTVQRPGMLIIEGQDKRPYLQTAIDDGKITSDEVLGLFYVGGNTILKVPVGTVIAVQ